MAQRRPARKGAAKSAGNATATGKASRGFTDEEKAAMRERVDELKAGATEGESAVLAKIAGMTEPDRTLAKRLHALIRESAPSLTPRTWYGMPAYANGDGKVVVFFRNAGKFKERYATLGFNPEANLDDGAMWATSFALTELTAADEARIGALVRKAVS